MFKKVTKHYSRSERKEGVLLTLGRFIGGRGVTMNKIAFWINMRPSTHLRGILEEMADSGLLSVEVVPHRRNVKKKLYSLTLLGVHAADAVIDSVKTSDVLDF